MGQHPQFDLAVVHRQQLVAFGRNKGPSHLTSGLGANRDILQIGIAAAQTPGAGAGLIVAGMHAPGRRIDQFRQSIDIGTFEFGKLAVFQNLHQYRMGGIRLESLQRDHISRIAVCGLLQTLHRQAQLAEQYIVKLLGAVDIKRAVAAAEIVNLLLDLQQCLCKPLAEIMQEPDIQRHTRLLHGRQHRHQRHFQRVVQGGQRSTLQFGPQMFDRTKGDGSVGRGIGSRIRHRDLIHRLLFFALANQVFDRCHDVM